MNDDVQQVVVSPDVYMMQIRKLQNELEKTKAAAHDLEVQLGYERSLREKPPEEEKKKAPKKHGDAPYTDTYSDFKSDGVRKPHAADSIRSYDDFKAIQDYFLAKNDVRDWALWTVGVSLGLRVSDLFSLRFGHMIDRDRATVKPRLEVCEQKTGKLNDLLITESVKNALEVYMKSLDYRFSLDGYLFASKKTGRKMYEEHGWRILSTAGKKLGLPIVIGSHTMRKSFANIAACVDRSSVDMNAYTKIQGLLNHSDQRVTMRYLGTYREMFDRARMAVSDFVLGKSGVNVLIAGDRYTVDDVMDRLDVLEDHLTNEKEAQ